jgi:hypothetical protein
VWQAPPTTQAERQERLSRLVQPIALTPVEGSPRQPQGQGRWHTEATTALWVPRPSQRDRWRTPPTAVETIAAWATGRTDDALAAALNARGLPSGRGQPFTAAAVAWIRDQEPIPKPGSDPRVAARTDARLDGRYATPALATHLGGTSSTVHGWRAQGLMPASQATPSAPWWHKVTPAVLAALRTSIRRAPLRTHDSWIPNAHCRRGIMHTPSGGPTDASLFGHRL